MKVLDIFEVPWDTRSLYDNVRQVLLDAGWAQTFKCVWKHGERMYRYEHTPGKHIEVVVDGGRVQRMYVYHNCALIGEYQRIKMALRFYSKYMEGRNDTC